LKRLAAQDETYSTEIGLRRVIRAAHAGSVPIDWAEGSCLLRLCSRPLITLFLSLSLSLSQYLLRSMPR
jgi:hypothetical protein